MNRSFKKSFAGRKRLASTFVDMLAGLAMSATLVSLVAIDLQSRRETARNSQCQNNLRNIGIAIFSYHRTYQHFPIHGTGTHQESSGTAGHGDAGSRGVGGQGGGNNGKQLSMFVGILPFMGQQDLWDQISQRSSDTVHGKLAEDAYWPAMGPATSQRNYLPWITDLSLLRCPTDPRTGEITGRTNYAACLGDAIDAQMDSALRFDPMTASWNVDPQMADRVRAAARGAFVFRERMSFADISDGLSNTLLIGEIATSLVIATAERHPLYDLVRHRTTCPYTADCLIRQPKQ
ncbi:DUF1559 domain-containing protein [Rhodopirellula sp. MGV]|uniref:DUF1559 family PulG-like putative transporter n=1 Tax=Rhodopirellula sp. MGV TaxID=2023130 RepID=UPI000B95DAA0|nr:DUF1559 domain-containing protein [Rhodopirellula sp. MGV]OYP37492.1 hypothetical protein CGZ80_05015 [Rhodopirellula sp. MGV]PNY37894.1 DUF1559 domain-containing protein [Rhodopirellula baltica]